MTKKTISMIVAVSILSSGVVVATNAFAQTTNGQSSIPSLAQEIAKKFHLNQKDVQSVFDQHKNEVQARMESNYENYLNNLVKAGKITQQQEQLILAEHKQLISQSESNASKFKNMTPSERRAQFQATRQQVANWAKQNNINPQYLHPFLPRRGWLGKSGMLPKLTPVHTE